MTEQTIEQTEQVTEEAAEEVTEPSTVAQDAGQSDDTETETEAGKGHREAAKWRVKLRETEAERDTLRARLEALQTAEVVRQATGPGKLHDGADVLRDVALGDLLDEDGNVDPDKLSGAIETTIKAHPHLGQPRISGDIALGDRGKATAAASWADVIRS